MAEQQGLSGLRDIAPRYILLAEMTELTTAEEFGERIRLARKRAGFKTQEDLTKKAGWAQSTISAWETGQTVPDLGNRLLLGMRLVWLPQFHR